MSYQVLARKWRPRSFKDMVGQEHILRMLANALLQQRIHHAYLFTGTRGVGKTTLARILAKCLNCETGITPTPCGTCHICIAIDAGQFLDLYEVDAASRTKVEDTRELLDNVLYPPSQGRYKIYLIDEVHMLSNHSFNALLKTLEEPPEHVKFLLATTDPKRLPITILSRCLQFHLKRITPEQIAKHLAHICSSENIPNETLALDKLAKAADGSMRDALSLLDQAVAYGHGNVNTQEVGAMLGSMAQEDLFPLVEALATADGPQLFQVIAQFAERAPDFSEVLDELISLFHQLALAQIVPQALPSDENVLALAKRFTPEDIQIYYQIALLARRDLALTPSPQQAFEMSMLRMLAFKPLNVARMNAKHSSGKALESAPIINPTPIQAKIPTPEPHPPTQKPIPQPEPPPEIPIPSAVEWRDLLSKLDLTGMALALASNCTLGKLQDNRIELILAAAHQPMLTPKLKERIAEALSRHLQKEMQLEITISTSELTTPVKQHQQEQEQRLNNAKQNVLQDPRIKQLIEMYDATVEVSLVT